jgi:small redox-active disulfide protein 2
MMNIKVLGSGCPNCHKVEVNTREALAFLRPQGGAEIEHVKDPLAISEYVLKTPGLVINEKVVSEGRIPDTSEIMTWLADALTEADQD